MRRRSLALRSCGLAWLGRDPLSSRRRRVASLAARSVLRPLLPLHDTRPASAAKKIEWGHHYIQRGFVALHKLLEETAGKYCVGDEVTVADIALVPQVYNARRFKVNLDDFPIIKRIDAALCELDAFKRAAPEQMPDAA